MSNSVGYVNLLWRHSRGKHCSVPSFLNWVDRRCPLASSIASRANAGKLNVFCHAFLKDLVDVSEAFLRQRSVSLLSTAWAAAEESPSTAFALAEQVVLHEAFGLSLIHI